MATTKEKREYFLRNAMTVDELKHLLDGYHPDTRVVIANDYGDYVNTTELIQVEKVYTTEQCYVQESAYSHSGQCFERHVDDNDGYDVYELEDVEGIPRRLVLLAGNIGRYEDEEKLEDGDQMHASRARDSKWNTVGLHPCG